MRSFSFVRRHYGLVLLLLAFSLGNVSVGRAEDRDGWLLTVSRKTMARDDGRPDSYTQSIDRDLVLKVVLKNLSMKDREAGHVEYSILIKRWGGEIGATQRYSGKLDLKSVKTGEVVELNTGEFHIGGHLHGTSRIHVDELEAWKFSVVLPDKKTDFLSSSKFESLNKKAVAAR